MEKEIKERAEVRQGDMTEGPILKQLIMFALPLFIGALFNSCIFELCGDLLCRAYRMDFRADCVICDLPQKKMDEKFCLKVIFFIDKKSDNW